MAVDFDDENLVELPLAPHVTPATWAQTFPDPSWVNTEALQLVVTAASGQSTPAEPPATTPAKP